MLVSHRLLPPGHPATGAGDALLAAVGLPALFAAAGALLAVLALPAVLCAAPLGFEHSCRAAIRRALLPVAAGLALPLATLPFEGLFFRCPLPAVGATGLLIGGLAATWRLGALRPAGAAVRPVVLVVATVVGLGTAVMAWPAVQGDEPHYLLVAGSLIEDGDLDLARDYGERAYAPYHPAPLSPHYKPGVAAGSRYSMHGLGYPLALTPAWVVGRALGGAAVVPVARLLQVLVYAGLVALLFVTLRERLGARAALFGTLATAWLAPLVFAPLHLFPETLMVAAALLAYREITAGRRSPWLAAAPLAALPWLAVKTIPLALVLAGAAPWVRERPTRARIVASLTPLAVSLALHATFTWWLYGSLSPSALYLGSDPAFGRQPGYGASLGAYLADWPGALRTLIGYGIDQKEGLLLIGPHWLFAVAGVPWLWRHRRRETVVLAAAAAAWIGPYALSQQIGGQGPPARPLMGALWILAWPLAVGLAASATRVVAVLRGATLVVSVAITTAFFADPTLLPHDYPVTSSWLIRSLSPHGWELHRMFPLWLNVREAWPWAVALGWLAAALALAAICIRGLAPLPTGRTPPQRAAWAGATFAALAIGLVGLLAARTVVSDRHVAVDLGDGLRAWVRAAIPERAWVEANGAWVSGGMHEVVVTSVPPLAAARLGVRTVAPMLVRVGLSDGFRILPPADGWQRFDWRPPEGVSFEGGAAWLIAVDAERGVAPAEIVGGGDYRPLGALLDVERSPDER